MCVYRSMHYKKCLPGAVRTCSWKVAVSLSSWPVLPPAAVATTLQLYSLPWSPLSTPHTSSIDLTNTTLPLLPLVVWVETFSWMVILEPFCNTWSPFFQINLVVMGLAESSLEIVVKTTQGRSSLSPASTTVVLSGEIKTLERPAKKKKKKNQQFCSCNHSHYNIHA